MSEFKKIAEIEIMDSKYADEIAETLINKGFTVIVDSREGYECYLDIVVKNQ